MRRDLKRMAGRQYDIVVVGGGILGAWIGWEAACRDYDVAVVERNDFASGTTSASGKVIHGGIRYLQSLHPTLLLEALREQRTLASMAPSLTRPLTFLVPAAEASPVGNAVLRGGAWAWRGVRAAAGGPERLPGTAFLSAGDRSSYEEIRSPLGWPATLAYGDLQIRSPERLVIAILREANAKGTDVANYLEATSLLLANDRVNGIVAHDLLHGEQFTIEARHVVNATGAWAPGIESSAGASSLARTRFAKGTHVVLDRPEPAAAVALSIHDQGKSRNDGGTRRVFVMPWEGKTLVGATYASFDGPPDRCHPERAEISSLLSRVDEQWPGFALSDSDVLAAYSGLYPLFEGAPARDGSFQASLFPRVVDHAESDGVPGLVSAVAVKLTTARALAEEIVNLMETKLGGGSEPEPERLQKKLPSARITPIETVDKPESALDDPDLLRAMVHASIDDEMARTLGDFVFRRTWLGHKLDRNGAWLDSVAEAMGRHDDWSAARKTREVAFVRNRLGVRAGPPPSTSTT